MRFRKSDRRALLMIGVAIVAAWGGVLIDRLIERKREPVVTLETLPEDSLSYAPPQAQRLTVVYDAIPERVVETFPFDPNTADSSMLLRLGLAEWQVRSIYKYRAKGGRYHRVEDFKRVPGMTPEVWNRLAPVMEIGEAFRYYEDTEQRAAATEKPDTFPQQEKYRELVQLDINAVDSNALKMIPGIASVRARRILRYREQLGGFVALEQLSEIEGLPPQLDQWFQVQTGIFRPLRINVLSVSELARHPYINYAQARAIVNYRQNYGSIKSLGELRLLTEFTEDDFQRLEPYVAY